MTAQGDLRQRQLRLIREGFCPYCEAGPFKVPVGHITRVHDMNRRAVRDDLGLFYQDSLTSPEYHEEKSAYAKSAYEAGRIKFSYAKGYTKTLSKAALAMQKEKAALVPDGTRQRIGREWGARRIQEAKGRDALIVQLASEGITDARIAEQVGIHPRTIRTILDRNAQPRTARQRYAQSLKGKSGQGDEGRAAHLANLEADAAHLLEQYRSGLTVYGIAAIRGVRVGQIRFRLKQLGVVVPDGRADPNRPKPPRLPKPVRYCSVDDCERVHAAKGLCGMHYQRAQKLTADIS